MRRNSWTAAELRAAIIASTSYAGALRKLGLSPKGGNYGTLRRAIARFGISWPHFTGQGHLRGKSCSWVVAQPLKCLLVRGSTYQSSKLKLRLLKEGILLPVCSGCSKTMWRSRFSANHWVRIPLELEHKNGDHTDNRLENLELLCPNCHTFTQYYKGRNIGYAQRIHDKRKPHSGREKQMASQAAGGQ